MTRPNATNADPALRARISAILAAFAADPVADVLATVAEQTAASLRAEGWTLRQWSSAIGDLAAAGAAKEAAYTLGRTLLPDESAALEACIRAHLEAT